MFAGSLVSAETISDACLGIQLISGIPFHDPKNVNLKIMSDGQAILGDYLLGMQVGNEPDLYFLNGHRDVSAQFPQVDRNCLRALFSPTSSATTTTSLIILGSLESLST